MTPPITMSYSEARQNLTAVMRHCVDDCTPVVITSRQRKVVMLPYDEWEAELETWHQKDTPANVAHLKQSIEEIKLGETVSVSIQSLKERLKAAGHA
ncbi:MAG: type II toxin-antitoxin system Phd/YefM family antitoxin [Akkermansia sp.]|nr:type II toxin-antitoxin system Phd/YefM family antitoxin [Akkermansia sp.]